MDSWKICLRWKEGSSSWHHSSEVKNSYSIESAAHGLKNDLQNLPAFQWRVKHPIRQRFWYDAIQKEMKNVMVAFQPLGHDASPPIGYKWMKCHTIIDV
jgi:hypothetical protein